MLGRGWLAGLLMVALALLGAGDRDRDRFDVVVIDPGHGGEDLGARGPGGLVEKDLVLDLARRLANRLRARGLRVVLTRDGDRYVPLEERTAIANDARGDLFLSIHANAARGRAARGARGIETYFLSLEASDEAARRLAAAENEAFGQAEIPAAIGDDPLVAILGDLMQTEHMMESSELARLIQKRLARLDGSPSRGVKQAPLVVLMGLQMPAALVEVGFLTHPREARALRSSRHRERIARALADAIEVFGRRYDARHGVRRAKPAPRGGS